MRKWNGAHIQMLADENRSKGYGRYDPLRSGRGSCPQRSVCGKRALHPL